MKLGCGYPMGPFTLLDFVGLDTTYYIANIMFEEFREPQYAPPPLLKRMVLAGRLGRKSGQGFLQVLRELGLGALVGLRGLHVNRRETVLVRIGPQRQPAAEGRVGGRDDEDGGLSGWLERRGLTALAQPL